MTSLRLHRERFQVQQASARSVWGVFVTKTAGMPGSLVSGLGTLPGGYLPCGISPFFAPLFATKSPAAKNPEVDR